MDSSETAWPTPDAPGTPGIPPTWTSSAKDLVGTSPGPSRIWFTLGYGILNEVYYPRVDIPQIRDLGFIVSDGKGFWCEVKRQNDYLLRLPRPGVPAPTIVHRHARYQLTLRVAPDPRRDVLLIDVALEGDEDLGLHVLLAPHLGGTGSGNIAAAGRHYGRQVLWAEQGPFGLALAADNQTQGDAFQSLSAGYVGASDGWQDFATNGTMTWRYPRAGPGNVALFGRIERRCVLGLGFGASRSAAASVAVAALADPFDHPWSGYVQAWEDWHDACHKAAGVGAIQADLKAQFETSRMVLRCHMDKTYPGAMVASLSVPWGNTKDDRGGYHLVWPRDLVECATALLAVGGEAEARDVLRYLLATQHEDGHWNQNQWLGGTPFWQGVQLDETALSVILAALLHERDALAGIEVADMTRRALGFIARMGPVTDQDRWEEDRGINAFTLAVCIAALVAGAEFLGAAEKTAAVNLADYWNARIESWLYASGTRVSQQVGVAGHYFRVAPPEVIADPSARQRILAVKNRARDPGLSAEEQVSTDCLQLVRFGLRSADHKCVRNTVAVIDALLRVETPAGPAWRRYTADGYGEHPDGREFDGTGQGRAWPLLTGERGHYELLAGRDARPFLEAMTAMAGSGGMLPEQVWDAEPVPGRRLYPGRPTGSAMPLAWTHAEFVKLARARQLNTMVDCPRIVWQRYRGHERMPPVSVWSEQAPARDFLAGSDLRIDLPTEAAVRWRTGRDSDWAELATAPTLPGVHSATLAVRELPSGDRVEFCWQETGADKAGDLNAVVAVDSGYALSGAEAGQAS